MFMAADEFPLPYEYRYMDFHRRAQRAARRRRRAHDRVPRLRQHRPHAGRLPPAGRPAHPQHRPPPRQHALRHGQPGGGRTPRARRRSSYTHRQGAGRRDHAARSPRRSTSRSSPTPGASCTRTPRAEAHRMAAELIELGVDVHAVYRRLYEDLPVRPPPAPLARAQPRSALRRRLRSRSPTSRARTTRRPARSRPTPRASSTTSAPSRAPPSRRSCATCWPRTAPACARSACARPTGAWTCRDRARVRRRRAPPGRRLLHRAARGGARRAPARGGRRAALSAPGPDGPVRRPALPKAGRRDLARRGGACAQAARSEETGRRVKVGHAGTLDPFATGLLLVLVGAATRAQRFLMELPKTYRAVARLGWTLRHRRPRRPARAHRTHPGVARDPQRRAACRCRPPTRP